MWHKILPVILFLGYLFADDSWKVYDDSEIAVIHITLDPEDFQWIYENVQSDSLHPATVHFRTLILMKRLILLVSACGEILLETQQKNPSNWISIILLMVGIFMDWKSST